MCNTREKVRCPVAAKVTSKSRGNTPLPSLQKWSFYWESSATFKAGNRPGSWSFKTLPRNIEHLISFFNNVFLSYEERKHRHGCGSKFVTIRNQTYILIMANTTYQNPCCAANLYTLHKKLVGVYLKSLIWYSWNAYNVTTKHREGVYQMSCTLMSIFLKYSEMFIMTHAESR